MGARPASSYAVLSLALAACGARSSLVEDANVEPTSDAGPACAVDGDPCASPAACCSATCTGGACGTAPPACAPDAAPVVLVAGDAVECYGIAVDGTDVYWTGAETGLIQKVSKLGGAPVTLATTSNPRGLALDDAYVYWAADGGIARVPKAGGAPEMLGAATGFPWFIAVDDTSAYWTTYTGGDLMRVPKDGSAAPTALVSGEAVAFGLALVGDRILYTDSDGVLSLPKAGGAATVLVTGSQSPWSIAVDATTAYWTEACGPDCGAVRSVPQGGGAPAELATGLDAPSGIVTDGGELYWADFGGIGDGAIFKVVKEGGAPVTLVSGLYEPLMVAVDQSCVYWVDGAGTLTKVHK
jgi:hypothetical protein